MSLESPNAGHFSGRSDLPRLTVIRGLGAVVIVIGHFSIMKTLPSRADNDFTIDLFQALAVAGVSAFFVLSGFVLTWTTPPGVPSRLIWRRRFARLFPVHAVTWALAFATLALAGVAGEFWKMLPSLALVNVWIPNLEIFWGPNTPSWTLAMEAFFYALLPMLLVGAWRLPERRLFPALGAVAGAIVLWAVFVGQVVPPSRMITDGGTVFSRSQYFAIVAFTPARLLDFVLGILIARVVIAGKAPQGLRIWAYATLIGGYIAARWIIPQPLGFVAAFVPAAIVGVMYCATADLAGRPSRWNTPTTRWLGEISFSLYMVHWTVVYGVNRLLGEPTWSIPVAAVALVATMAVSIGLAQLLHKTVELPLYRRLRGPSFGRSVATPDPSVARAAVGTRPAGEALAPDGSRPTPVRDITAPN